MLVHTLEEPRCFHTQKAQLSRKQGWQGQQQSGTLGGFYPAARYLEQCSTQLPGSLTHNQQRSRVPVLRGCLGSVTKVFQNKLGIRKDPKHCNSAPGQPSTNTSEIQMPPGVWNHSKTPGVWSSKWYFSQIKASQRYGTNKEGVELACMRP